MLGEGKQILCFFDFFWFSLHFLGRIEGIDPFSEKESDLAFYSRDREQRESQEWDEDPLKEIPDVVIPPKRYVSSDDMDGEETREDDRRE